VTCGPGFAALSQQSVGITDTLGERPIQEVTSVRVVGVDPALARTLTARLETKVGTLVSEAPLRDDVRRLWRSGVVSEARVELEGAGQTGVVFQVEPRAAIDRVTVLGGDPQMARRFRLLAGAPYEPARLQRMADQAQLAYVRAGHLDAHVEVRRARHGTAVCVAANPGPRPLIAELVFPGRSAIAQADLVAAIRGEDKLNRAGGRFDAAALVENKIFLEVLYWEAGYANIRFGEPSVRRSGNRLVVAWPVDEGPKFRFGKVSTKQRIAQPIELRSGDVFSRSKVVRARDRLLADLGAFDIFPLTKLDVDTATIDITFDIQWRWPWQALALSSFSAR
jgi:outer membrane protein assembly factor BamA